MRLGRLNDKIDPPHGEEVRHAAASGYVHHALVPAHEDLDSRVKALFSRAGRRPGVTDAVVIVQLLGEDLGGEGDEPIAILRVRIGEGLLGNVFKVRKQDNRNLDAATSERVS